MNIFFIALSFALPPMVWLIGAYLMYTFGRGWLTLIFVLAWVASLVVSVSLLNAQIRDMTVKDYGDVLGAAWVVWVIGSIIAWIVGYFISDDNDDDAEDRAQAQATVDFADS